MKNIFKSLFICFVIFSFAFSQDESAKQKEKKAEATKNPVVIIETNMGNIELELYAKKTPKTVENFLGLVRKGYYDGVIFHRVIDNFMIQGGDPTGTGRGGESIWGREFEDEIRPELKHDSPGILSMANRGPNTNTSQFFITLVPTPWLDGRHTVFGKVIKGMDVVQAIGKVKTTKPGDRPEKDVVMKKVYVKGEQVKDTKKKK